MKKKILAGLLSAMMVVSLAACGSSETGATTTDSKNETTANTADGTAAAATDAQGGYEGKEVKVWISSGAEDDIYREMFDKIEGDLPQWSVSDVSSPDTHTNSIHTHNTPFRCEPGIPLYPHAQPVKQASKEQYVPDTHQHSVRI